MPSTWRCTSACLPPGAATGAAPKSAWLAWCAGTQTPGMLVLYCVPPYARLLARRRSPEAGRLLQQAWTRALSQRMLIGLGFAGTALMEWAWLNDAPEIGREVLTVFAEHRERPVAEPLHAEICRYAKRLGLPATALESANRRTPGCSGWPAAGRRRRRPGPRLAIRTRKPWSWPTPAKWSHAAGAGSAGRPGRAASGAQSADATEGARSAHPAARAAAANPVESRRAHRPPAGHHGHAGRGAAPTPRSPTGWCCRCGRSTTTCHRCSPSSASPTGATPRGWLGSGSSAPIDRCPVAVEPATRLRS